jgi:hypothetical protein
MQPVHNHANAFGLDDSPQQLKDLNHRMDNLVKRMRRSHRQVDDCLRRVLQWCNKSYRTSRRPEKCRQAG